MGESRGWWDFFGMSDKGPAGGPGGVGHMGVEALGQPCSLAGPEIRAACQTPDLCRYACLRL